MSVTWLGQGGFLFDFDGVKVIVDPYLSDSVEKIQPHNKRRVKVDSKFLEIKPDIIVLTHNHLDHTDPDTLKYYLGEDTSVTVLASFNAWKNVREVFGGINNNYVSFNRGAVWTEKGIRFEAVFAEHSDEYAIGVIIYYKNIVYYLTGDTLYSKKIFEDLPNKIDYIFLPVNGKGNNMNMVDAKIFCENIGGFAIPNHCGLFDDIDLNSFEYDRKIVPQIYKKLDI